MRLPRDKTSSPAWHATQLTLAAIPPLLAYLFCQYIDSIDVDDNVLKPRPVQALEASEEAKAQSADLQQRVGQIEDKLEKLVEEMARQRRSSENTQRSADAVAEAADGVMVRLKNVLLGSLARRSSSVKSSQD